MLTTIDGDGHFVSRPMAQQEVEFTADPQVGVTSSSNDTWVSLSGTARVVTDAAKAKVTGKPHDGGENETVRL